MEERLREEDWLEIQRKCVPNQIPYPRQATAPADVGVSPGPAEGWGGLPSERWDCLAPQLSHPSPCLGSVCGQALQVASRRPPFGGKSAEFSSGKTGPKTRSRDRPGGDSLSRKAVPIAPKRSSHVSSLFADPEFPISCYCLSLYCEPTPKVHRHAEWHLTGKRTGSKQKNMPGVSKMM